MFAAVEGGCTRVRARANGRSRRSSARRGVRGRGEVGRQPVRGKEGRVVAGGRRRRGARRWPSWRRRSSAALGVEWMAWRRRRPPQRGNARRRWRRCAGGAPPGRGAGRACAASSVALVTGPLGRRERHRGARGGVGCEDAVEPNAQSAHGIGSRGAPPLKSPPPKHITAPSRRTATVVNRLASRCSTFDRPGPARGAAGSTHFGPDPACPVRPSTTRCRPSSERRHGSSRRRRLARG